jgi:hypothetical protein
LLVVDYRLALTVVALFLTGFVLTRKTVLPGMFAFACLPAASLWLAHDVWTTTLTAVVSAMVVFAHRKNCLEEIALWSARRSMAPKPEITKL